MAHLAKPFDLKGRWSLNTVTVKDRLHYINKCTGRKLGSQWAHIYTGSKKSCPQRIFGTLLKTMQNNSKFIAQFSFTAISR